MSARIAWIDADAPHAGRALQALRQACPQWVVVQTDAPGFRLAPAQDWDAVVLCLDGAADQLPPWAQQAGRAPLLLCLRTPAQEVLAARALRAGLGDYVVRGTDADGDHEGNDGEDDEEGEDGAHLPPLLQRLQALVARSRAQPTVIEDSALVQLQLQRSQLMTALGSMSHGIFQTGADGAVNVYNQRVLELLQLPESLMAARPTLMDITRVQIARGDFGDDYALVDERGRGYTRSGAREPSPELYWRKTHDGRTLEVRTAALPYGGMVRTFADVSDYVRVEGELRLSEARFRGLSDLSSDWYWEQDADYRFTHFSGGEMRKALHLDELVGQLRWDMPALNMTDDDWAAHRALLQARKPFRDLELQRLQPDGSIYWTSMSGAPIFDAEGVFRGYRGVGRDISERKRIDAQVTRLAYFDVLTGLPNRRMLTDRLALARMAAQRSGGHAALLFIDLDNFKDLNDTQGHHTGDRLLVQVAGRLKDCVRDTDTVARFGGDEFVVLAPGLPPDRLVASQEAGALARKIIAALSQPYLLEGLAHHSTPSIGLTLFAREPHSVDDLLKHADLAMYEAKAAGRNTVRFFDPEMQEAVRARSVLESQLRHGLQTQELLVHYQPIVNSAGRMVGAEALVRWQHPQRGMVPPSDFIALAEQSGLILPLGQWVLQRACAQLVAWSRSSTTRHLVVSVNVSVRQFRQADFADQVLHALRSSGAQARQLKIELTESLLLTDAEEVVAKLDLLRAHGVGFALDDFGTGYSSLSYLKRLPLDELKIDRSFVRDVLTDPNDAAIVRTILALAQSLDLTVVAEGVETTGQLDFLQRHGCHAFQGYLFGRPAPAAAIDRALRPAA
ncbi:MAG: EAL domain-containing protein [Comamonadaceae bacterium]|nr:MAG: EAL domain-containing protein [Comamonadaceae bacterium]